MSRQSSGLSAVTPGNPSPSPEFSPPPPSHPLTQLTPYSISYLHLHSSPPHTIHSLFSLICPTALSSLFSCIHTQYNISLFASCFNLPVTSHYNITSHHDRSQYASTLPPPPSRLPPLPTPSPHIIITTRYTLVDITTSARARARARASSAAHPAFLNRSIT